MNLDRAIEIVTKERRDHHSFPTDIIGKAEQLLIEAGKRLKEHREEHIDITYRLLPGETED